MLFPAPFELVQVSAKKDTKVISPRSRRTAVPSSIPEFPHPTKKPTKTHSLFVPLGARSDSTSVSFPIAPQNHLGSMMSSSNPSPLLNPSSSLSSSKEDIELGDPSISPRHASSSSSSSSSSSQQQQQPTYEFISHVPSHTLIPSVLHAVIKVHAVDGMCGQCCVGLPLTWFFPSSSSTTTLGLDPYENILRVDPPPAIHRGWNNSKTSSSSPSVVVVEFACLLTRDGMAVRVYDQEQEEGGHDHDHVRRCRYVWAKFALELSVAVD